VSADDWLALAAAEAREHLSQTLRPRFRTKQWVEFNDRLAKHFDGLFRCLHRLYGWQYDFAWTVESIIQVAASGYLERSKRLHKADRAGARSWITEQGTTWAMAYFDLFAGNVAGLTDRIGYLQSLGVTHLHMLGLEPNEESADLAKQLNDAGISLVLDLTLNHTSSDHKWARAAAAGKAEQGYYFLYTDRSIPDQFAPHLKANAPDRGGDSFTWHSDVQGGRWIWTTFQPFEWDLNYSNPRVLAAIAGELLGIANLGIGALRLNSVGHLWKTPGTACEDLPEAHLIVQVLQMLVDIAAPAVVLISEVPAFVNSEECRLGYNDLLMSSIWEAIATADTRLLRIALGDRYHRSPGSSWLTYLRDHNQIHWEFLDEDAVRLAMDPTLHRLYLNSFYSGEASGSFAKGALVPPNGESAVAGIAGTLASLAGLEAATENMDPTASALSVRRILAAWAVVVAAAEIPLFLLGDEIAIFNDHTHRADPQHAADVRWMQRPRFDQVRMERALAGIGPEAEVLAGFKGLLAARRALSGVDPTTPIEPIDPGEIGVVAFGRGRSLLVANLTDRIALVARDSLPEGEYFDLISQEVWDGHVLGPFEHRLLQL
jgi:hypothetical protein